MFDVFYFLPEPVVWLFSFVFGVIIGSFLNVYIYRLHTGKSLAGRSHCLSCGTPLKFYELIPLFSYLFLRGKCRTCGCHIPVRYFLVEFITAVLFTGVVMVISEIPLILLAWWLMAVLVVTVVYDIYHMIILDKMVVMLLIIVFFEQFYLLVNGLPVLSLFFNLMAATSGTIFLFLLWWLSKGKWVGLGDVKLVWPLGVLAGYTKVFSFLVFSFWTGAIIGLVLLALQKLKRRGQPHLRFLERELTIKSAVPFAPFLVIGFLLVFFFSVDVIDLLIYVP